MTVLYLTNNTQLAGTARILLSWLTLGRQERITGCVVVPRPGQLSEWLSGHTFDWIASPMPVLERRRPVRPLLEAWRIARWARRRGVTLVHCNEHDVFPFGVLVARLMRVPVVCHVRFRLDRGFAQWAFGGWRRPDALLWTTNQQRQDSAAAIEGVVAAARQHLIPLGPDTGSFRFDPALRAEARGHLGLLDDEIAVGAATALRPIKRLGDFVNLIEELAARHPRVVGLLAGGVVPDEVAYARDIQAQIEASGLGRRLRWLGHLEPISPFLRALDIFVSTSEYETFGNSVAEAMACRVPVVGYVGGSVHEIIGDAGTVVENGDIAALVTAVDVLVGDEAKRGHDARAGERRVADTFDPAVSFRKLRDVYRSVLPGAA